MAVLLAACQPAQPPADDLVRAEPETVLVQRADGRAPVEARRHMVIAGHPLAAAAGRDILRAGGNALDAAVAVQMVLTLVEPQSSGIGGGGFLVHFDRARGAVSTYDGRERAPASAHPAMFLDGDGKTRRFDDIVAGGMSVGVPGVVRMLEMAHRAHGRLPWPRLFERAIELAEAGFEVSPRLAASINRDRHLKAFPASAAYFYGPDGRAKARLANPELAATLRAIAAGGADAFYTGAIAADIASAVSAAPRNAVPFTTQDLAGYRAVERAAVCGGYRAYRLCGMGPPTSGGIAALQILGMLESRPLDKLAPLSAESVHLIAEASRLAYADRALYVGDPDFVQVPVQALIDPLYLSRRARLISPERAMGRAAAGDVGEMRGALAPDPDADALRETTTHISIVDDDGNAVAFTTTIENVFGSRLFVRGFLLNNQMTDFAGVPAVGGRRVANRVEPGKRPRSSMTPTLVFDRSGRLVLVAGSPGGTRIIGFVTNALIAMLDWKLDPQAAAALPHFGNRNGPTELEARTAAAELKPALEKLGHTVEVDSMISGLALIRVAPGRLVGGADPRREETALGD